MKRHESIVLLSRDHHFGLLFCWKIRQGVKKGVATERIQPYIHHFWESHLQQHFQEEETLLFSKVNDALSHQAVEEHRAIEQLVSIIHTSKGITTEALTTIADKVDNHIRFEERVLFPHLENVLTTTQLEVISNHLQQHHVAVEDNFSDEFWK